MSGGPTESPDDVPYIVDPTRRALLGMRSTISYIPEAMEDVEEGWVSHINNLRQIVVLVTMLHSELGMDL
jgi:hypothetical protein